MRRIIPFYSFTKFNLEMQVKTLVSKPGRIAAQTKAMRTFSDVFSNDDLTDEEKDKLPSWMTRGFYALRKQEDGTLKSLMFTESPVAQPFDALTAKGILGSVSPFIRTPIEQMTGYDMYHGKPFSEVTNASGYKHAPSILKKYIGYDEIHFTDSNGKKKTWSVSLRPSRLNMVSNLPISSRVLSSIRQLSGNDITAKQKAMEQLFGASYMNVDMNKILKYEDKRTMKEYTDVLDTANVIYSFSKNITNKKEE